MFSKYYCLNANLYWALINLIRLLGRIHNFRRVIDWLWGYTSCFYEFCLVQEAKQRKIERRNRTESVRMQVQQNKRNRQYMVRIEAIFFFLSIGKVEKFILCPIIMLCEQILGSLITDQDAFNSVNQGIHITGRNPEEYKGLKGVITNEKELETAIRRELSQPRREFSYAEKANP